MLVGIIVGYAIERPPSDQEFSFVVVEAETEVEASLIAAQVTACHAEMVTSTTVHTLFEV